MAEPPSPLVDVVVRLGHVLLALAVIIAAVGSLVATYVTGRLSEEGDPVPLGLV